MKRLISFIFAMFFIFGYGTILFNADNGTKASDKLVEEQQTVDIVILDIKEIKPVKVIGVSAVQKPYISLTESEKLILATLIRLECGGSSYETKAAVASVVINRMTKWKCNLRSIVFAKNQFSPARLIDKETGKSYYNPPKTGVYGECWTAMEAVLMNGPTLPEYVLYFRSGHYHTWTIPYAKIGPMYFSYVKKYK
jgi:hypothetical protein